MYSITYLNMYPVKALRQKNEKKRKYCCSHNTEIYMELMKDGIIEKNNFAPLRVKNLLCMNIKMSHCFSRKMAKQVLIIQLLYGNGLIYVTIQCIISCCLYGNYK